MLHVLFVMEDFQDIDIHVIMWTTLYPVILL